MAKTAAQRQADYRKNRATAGDNGERRINTWVTTGAALALARLSKYHGITNREILERLILAADQQRVDTLDPDTEEWATYFSVTA
jgi:hypothetical protein